MGVTHLVFQVLDIATHGIARKEHDILFVRTDVNPRLVDLRLKMDADKVDQGVVDIII